MEKLLTTNDVCGILGVKPRTVARLVHDGELACIQITARERRFLDQVAKPHKRFMMIMTQAILRKASYMPI